MYECDRYVVYDRYIVCIGILFIYLCNHGKQLSECKYEYFYIVIFSERFEEV